MTKNQKTKNLKKIINDPLKILLLLFTFAASVKMICCGWIIDEGYAFAIGNRLLNGDKLFRDLWELHQTSGYAVEFFLWVFRTLTGSIEGEVVFVRACGMLVHLLVSYAVYRSLKRHIPEDVSFICAIVYANLSPKQLCTPEFSNILLWTSTLVLILIDRLWSLDENSPKKERILFPILTGIFLSLCVVSYPQALLFAVFAFACILLKGKERKKNFLIVLSVCVIAAVAYMAYILSVIPLPELITTIGNMIEVDHTHAEGASKIVRYAGDLGITALFVTGFAVLSNLTALAFKNKKLTVPFSLLYIFLWKFIHYMFRTDFYSIEYTFGGILFAIVIAFIYFLINRSSLIKEENRNICFLFGTGGLFVLGTVLIACDQSVFSSAKYMSVTLVALLAVTMDISGKKERIITFLAVLLIVFVNIVQLGNPKNRLLNITDADARVPAGPQKWLVMERVYANKARIDYEELPALLDGADYVMITGDAVTYLYTDAGIGNGSTIMTEDYGERFGIYWEVYPEKSPDIIAIGCYNGQVEYPESTSWLYEYASGEFGADEVIDTTYYRLFIKNR